MKKKQFPKTKIVSMLRQQEAGKSFKDIAREQGISESTLYKWKAKYGGLKVSDVEKMNVLEKENAKLKRVIANLTLMIINGNRWRKK
jgi:putative transposase